MIELGKTKEHLFISYAWEDGALAEWLTLKLTAEGYRVWCDRFKLLGGERWPDDIDSAIRNDTFRMLHLVSVHSLHKPNPSKERQLALLLERERNHEFLIPLNADGTKASDLPWQMTDITYIPFQNWGTGLAQLTKKLKKEDTPRPLVETGMSIASHAIYTATPILPEIEDLQSNCYPLITIPEVIHLYKMSRHLTSEESERLSLQWAFRKVGVDHVVSFSIPSSDILQDLIISKVGGAVWSSVLFIEGIKSLNLVSELIKKSLIVKAYEKGLRFTPDKSFLYFRDHVLEKNEIKYQGYRKRKTRVQVIGLRHFSAEKFKHHLGVLFRVRRDIDKMFTVQLKLRLYITNEHGESLVARAALARRKQTAKNWWNHEWFSRQMAIALFLADDSDHITIGKEPESQIIVSASPLAGVVDKRIDERFLEFIRSGKIGLIIDRDEYNDEEVPDEIQQDHESE